jgi:hypothetical protein
MNVPAQVSTAKAGEIMEAVLVRGDVANLNPQERAKYYVRVCESLGLNPMTRPFEFITLNGKLTFYARKDCTDQLRSINGVSVTDLLKEDRDGIFIVTAKVIDKHGRTDAATGAVAIGGLKGEAMANAIMKAETKAKRRATLSICGLGFLDETEVEDFPEGRRARATSTPPPIPKQQAPAQLSKQQPAQLSPPDDGPRETWDDPPAEEFDGAAWLNELGGALDGCETLEQLSEVQRRVQAPAKDLASKADWVKGRNLSLAAWHRLNGTGLDAG